MLARWVMDPLDQEHACMDCTDSTPADLVEEMNDNRRENEARLQQESDDAFMVDATRLYHDG